MYNYKFSYIYHKEQDYTREWKCKDVLNYLNTDQWEFLCHDDVVSKHKVMQELIESRDVDNINIVIEMYKTLKNEVCKSESK